jgi:hypothetical protein
MGRMEGTWPDQAPDVAMTAWRNELENNDEIGVVFTDKCVAPC